MEYSILKLNKKSNTVTIKELDWDEFISRVKDPLPGDKNTRSLVRFGLVKEGLPIVSKELVTWTTYLILDYDENVKIDEFKNKFNKVSYILYTSYSNSKYKNKFKVIVKPSCIIHSSWLDSKDYVDYLINTFKIGKGIPDVSCFNNSQFQLLPIKTSTYEYCVNKWDRLLPVSIKSIHEMNHDAINKIKMLEKRDSIKSMEKQSARMVTKTGCKITFVSLKDARKELHKELDRVHTFPRPSPAQKRRIKEELKHQTLSPKKWVAKEYGNKFEAIQSISGICINMNLSEKTINYWWKKKYGVEISSKWKNKLDKAIESFSKWGSYD